MQEASAANLPPGTPSDPRTQVIIRGGTAHIRVARTLGELEQVAGSPSVAQVPPFLQDPAAAVEHYLTAAYDAEQRGELARAEQLRAIAHCIRTLDQRAFARWYATTDHPR